jgi:hypothetical protein
MSIETSQPRREFLTQIGALAAAGVLSVSSSAVNAAPNTKSRQKAAQKTGKKPAAPSKPAEPSKSPQKPVDLATLRAEQFRPLEKQRFTLRGPNGDIPLVLTEVTDLSRSNDEDRSKKVRPSPFLLLFNATNFDKVPAKIYTLSNPKIGTFDVYLNEVRADDDPATVQYAVVFN